jgi:outer membrane biosynthesis protein TonB
MMMGEWRDPPQYTVESNWSVKLIAAAIVVIGFSGMGVYAYESGTWNSTPVAAVAPKTVAQQTAAAAAPAPDVPPALAAPESTPPAAQPVKDAVPGTPEAVPAQAQSPAKPVKVARVQHDEATKTDTAPAASQKDVSAPKPAEIAATAAPAEPKAQDAAPAAAVSADLPAVQDKPADSGAAAPADMPQ